MQERTVNIMVDYSSAEQLRTILYFLEPIIVTYEVKSEDNGLNRAYITVAA